MNEPASINGLDYGEIISLIECSHEGAYHAVNRELISI